MKVMSPVNLLPTALSDLFAQATTSGRITLADRYGLLAAMFDESLSEEERFSIDRLLRSVCRGRIQIVDELSVII